MKKTSAISGLDIERIIENIDKVILELKDFEKNEKGYIEIVNRENVKGMSELFYESVEAYKKVSEEIAKKYEVSKYYDFGEDVFIEYIETYRINLKLKEDFKGKLSEEIDINESYHFREEIRKAAYDIKKRYDTFKDIKENVENPPFKIRYIIQDLNTSKENLEDYLKIKVSYENLFQEVLGKNTERLRVYLKEFLDNYILKNLSIMSKDVESTSIENIERIPILYKKIFTLWLKLRKIENYNNDKIKDEYNQLIKDLNNIYNTNDRFQVINSRSTLVIMNKVKDIYDSLAGKIDKIDEFGQREFDKLLEISQDNIRLKPLEEFLKFMKGSLMFFDQETGNVSYKKVIGLISKLLSKHSGISESSVNKIIGGLIKRGYNYLFVDIFKSFFDVSNEELATSLIIFEKVYGRKISSPDDFLKYFEFYKSLLDLRREVTSFEFSIRDFHKLLYTYERYFENMQPNKKINIKSLIDNVKTQTKRYIELQDIIHNNYVDDDENSTNIKKELDNKLMTIAGGKKYSVPHKDLINVVSSLLGFNESDDDDDYHDDYDSLNKDPAFDNKLKDILTKLINYLEVLFKKYSKLKEEMQHPQKENFFYMFENAMYFLKNIILQDNLSYRKKSIGNTIIDYFIKDNLWMKFITPEELEIIREISKKIVYECEVPIVLNDFVYFKSKEFLKAVEFLDNDILLSVGLNKDPYNDDEDYINIEDAINKIINAFAFPEKYSFSQLKEISELCKKVMYIISVSNVKEGYANLFSKIESLEDVEEEINYKLPKVSGKHPALFDLDMNIGKDYRFRVLESKDARHLTIGIETDCCQRLGGAGEKAAIDSFINPLAGVLVLERDNGSIMAQSYFHYVPQKNLYILDNIEGFPNKMGKEKMEEAYIELANKLKKEKGIESFRIGQTYTVLSFENAIEKKVEKEEEDPRYFAVEDPYSDYTDGTNYWDLLADKNEEEKDKKEKEFDYKPFEKAISLLKGKNDGRAK